VEADRQGVSVAAGNLQPAAADRSQPAPAPSAGAIDVNDMQRVANDRLWGSGRLVDAYATRILRPVEADILVRFRTELSGRVLELGSGAGRLTGYLAEIAAEVRGVDISPEMVAYSRRRYPRVSFAQGDLRDPAIFGPGPWDAVVAPFNVVDVFGDADRQALLDRIHAALVPGGLFVMSSHNRAVADRLGDPLRQVGLSPRGLVSTAVHLPRRWLNRRRLVGFQRNEPSYAILNDVAHDYAVLHYYITRDDQARQLADHGFELVECLDLDGAPVEAGADAAHCSELHYVARRPG
jgi:SAM-dependent methyltransferase